MELEATAEKMNRRAGPRDGSALKGLAAKSAVRTPERGDAHKLWADFHVCSTVCVFIYKQEMFVYNSNNNQKSCDVVNSVISETFPVMF